LSIPPSHLRLPIIFLGISATCSLAPLFAQATSSSTDGVPVFKANARSVIVDVVATDRNGEPVRGLRKQDFLIEEDGQPQKIDYFEEHTGAQTNLADLPPLPANVFTNIPRVRPTDSVTVLLFDSLNTQVTSQIYVRSQMLKYLKNPVLGRQMAIFTLNDKLRLIQRFTDDPSVLAAILNNLKGGAAPKQSPELSSDSEAEGDAVLHSLLELSSAGAQAIASEKVADAFEQSVGERSALHADQRAEMTLQAFQFLAHYLAGIPGRKSVIWFSSSFPVSLFANPKLIRSDAVEANLGDHERELRRTETLLADARVAVYPVAAEGLALDPAFDTSDTSLGGGEAQFLKNVKDDPASDHQTMEEVARETGGEAFYNTNDLKTAVNQIAESGSHFYTLGYSPTNPASDGRFRKVHVKLADCHCTLDYRHGYYADDAKTDLEVASKPASDPLQPLMNSGVPDSTQIAFALRVHPGIVGTGASAGENRQSDHLKAQWVRYRVQFAVEAVGLQLDTSADGGRFGKLEASLVAYDRDGHALNSTVKEIDLNMNSARYAAVLQHGVNFFLEIDIPKEATSLRSGVYDLASSRAGTLEVSLSSIAPTAQKASFKSR
jgi:VWFA-related protein